jgi:hypothetical protein
LRHAHHRLLQLRCLAAHTARHLANQVIDLVWRG